MGATVLLLLCTHSEAESQGQQRRLGSTEGVQQAESTKQTLRWTVLGRISLQDPQIVLRHDHDSNGNQALWCL